MTARATGRGPRALSRFFAQHQACGGKFDIGRPEGGLVRVTCSVCGARFIYETAARSLPEGSAMPARALDPLRDHADGPPSRASDPAAGPTSRAAGDPPDLGPGGSGGRAFGTEAEAAPTVMKTPGRADGPKEAPRLPGRGRGRLKNRWVDALIVAAMLCAAAIIVLSVAGVGEEGDDGGPSSASAPEPERPSEPDPGGGAPAAEREREADGQSAPIAEADVDLGRERTFFSAYQISIPRSWETMRHGTFVEFVCKDRRSDVRVYHERRSGQPEEMEDELRRFIRDEHPGAHIGPLERTRVGGADAASLTARFGGSVETATVVSGSPYMYLIVSSWDESASEKERAAARAVVNSFRPA